MKPIVLIVALAGVPLGASAQSTPVKIQNCEILQYVSTRVHPFWYPWGPYPNYGSPYTDGLRISYENVSSKVATRVAFLVNYRGDVEHVADAGTFSPNVTIDHTFSAFSGLAWIGPRPNVCRPVAVRFADGTVWRASGFPIRQAPAQ